MIMICCCATCSHYKDEMCMHTTDIEHAKNFQKLEDTGVWMEKEEKEVIRCKDCKWFGEIGCAIRIVDDSDKPKEDDYCSFAERRSDE